MENQIAKFRFKGFSIRKSTIEIKNYNVIAPKISLGFDLSGEHMRDDSCYNLYMKIKVVDANKAIQANVEAVGYYEFDKDCCGQELANYFYINAPAILFPYVRAYIATLSTLSGLPTPIMLPTMNLTKFADQLKNNTQVK